MFQVSRGGETRTMRPEFHQFPNQVQPVGVLLEASAGASECLGVAVDADEVGLGEAGEQRLAVTAEPQRAVDEDRAGPGERRLQELHDPVEQHRDVGGGGHRQPW